MKYIAGVILLIGILTASVIAQDDIDDIYPIGEYILSQTHEYFELGHDGEYHSIDFSDIPHRILQLEAELRRTAALMYMIASRGNIDPCTIIVEEPIFTNYIDECLMNVTIEEETP